MLPRILPAVPVQHCRFASGSQLFGRNAWLDSGYVFRVISWLVLDRFLSFSTVNKRSDFEVDAVQLSYGMEKCARSMFFQLPDLPELVSRRNSCPDFRRLIFTFFTEKERCAQLMLQLPCGLTVSSEPELANPLSRLSWNVAPWWR